MFVKRGKKKDIGNILLGFAVLMTGMTMMSDAVAPLKNDPAFQNILTMFTNPVLGILAGIVLTVIIQSSSASVGILQALTVTGAISYGAAIPIVMGQNIGTCITALISALGANKNGKRAAIIHLSFNVIGVVIVSIIFYAVNAIVGQFTFLSNATNAWDIAIIHTLFKIICVAIIGPFYRQLEKISRFIIRDKGEEEEVNILDERLFGTPAVAVKSATDATVLMAEVSCKALKDAISLLDGYDAKLAESIRVLEGKADDYEDQIGSYLVKLSAYDMSDADSNQITKLLLCYPSAYK
jgi:phosphate:Na+ symporter